MNYSITVLIRDNKTGQLVSEFWYVDNMDKAQEILRDVASHELTDEMRGDDE